MHSQRELLGAIDTWGPVAHRIKPELGFSGLIGPADLSARRTFGRLKIRFNPSPPPFSAEKTAESPDGLPVGRSAGQKSSQTFGRPKARLNPSTPLVLIPPYTNNPPPCILITRLLQWP